ncbi:MAG: hypothetical protein IT452_14615 [Planctomycetia bacterium]|nr:hypothetical protein [Planctomycetia bacterium]
MSFALLLVAHAGLWILAIALQRRVPAESRAASVALAGVMYAAVASVLALGLGACGWLTAVPMTVAGAAAGAAGFALGGAKALREAWEGAVSAWRGLAGESKGVAALLGVFAAFLVLRQAANAWLFVPYTFDEHAYHLPHLVTWVQAGSIARPEMADTRAYFPAGMQLLQAWWVAIPRHDVLVEAASLQMAAVGAAAVAAMARSLGAARAGALLAGLLWACAPLALAQGSSAMNDLAAGTTILAAAAFLVRPVSLRRALLLAGLAVAVGAGIKPTVLFAVPGLALLAVAAKRRAAEVASAGAAPWCRPTAAALGAVAVLCGAWWYAANAIEFGNPFFPVLAGSGASQEIGPLPVKMSGGPSFRNLGASRRDVFGPRYVRFDPLVTPLADRTGWGMAISILGPPALVWLLVKDRRWRAPAAAFAVAVFAVFLLVAHDPWNARFVLWAAALPAAALGTVAPRIPRGWIAVTIVVYAAGADLVRMAVPAAFWQAGPAGKAVVDEPYLRGFLKIPWERRDARQLTLVRYVGVPGGPDEALRWQDRYDENMPLLCVAAGWPTATLARGDYRRRIEYAVPESAEELLETMKARGCRRLFVWSPPAGAKKAVEDAVASGALRQIHTAWYERTGP